MAARKPLVLVDGETQQLQAADWIDLSDDINLTVSSPITLTDDDVGLDETAIDHNNLLNYVANEHIDWTSTNENLSTSGSITTPTLTDGRVVLAGSGGVLEDSANLTFDGVTLSTLVMSVPATTTALSGILKIGNVAIHNYESSGSNGKNLFIGESSGNYTLDHLGVVIQASSNVGLGYGTLDALTTGYQNVAVGFQACTSITIGYNNFGVGYNSLALCVDGHDNVAFGNGVLVYLISGQANVAIGTAAGFRITGNRNVFIGSNAGGNASASTVESNVGIGTSVFSALTTGGYNVGIGREALIAVTTQSNNVGIGFHAGQSCVGASCVFIGHEAGAFETASSKLFIDNTVRASEADGRIKALIYGVFAATTAAQYLAINGHLIALEDLETPVVLTPEIKTDTSAPTDLTITTGAAKTIILATSVFEDLQFPVATGKVTPASGEPSWETFTTNTKEFAFDVNDYIDLQANELFHHWKEGTDGHLHIHYTIKTAQSTGANRFVKFSVWVAYSDKDEVWVEQAVLSFEDTVPTGSSALQAFYLDMGNATLTNYLRGGQVKVRVKRIAATGGTEYADDVFITQVGMHLEVNKIGSVVEED